MIGTTIGMCSACVAHAACAACWEGFEGPHLLPVWAYGVHTAASHAHSAVSSVSRQWCAAPDLMVCTNACCFPADGRSVLVHALDMQHTGAAWQDVLVTAYDPAPASADGTQLWVPGVLAGQVRGTADCITICNQTCNSCHLDDGVDDSPAAQHCTVRAHACPGSSWGVLKCAHATVLGCRPRCPATAQAQALVVVPAVQAPPPRTLRATPLSAAVASGLHPSSTRRLNAASSQTPPVAAKPRGSAYLQTSSLSGSWHPTWCWWELLHPAAQPPPQPPTLTAQVRGSGLHRACKRGVQMLYMMLVAAGCMSLYGTQR